MELIKYVSLAKIRDNLISLKRFNKRLMLMLKADAYGHGLTQVARATEDIVQAFGVVTVEEGEALRSAGITADILVLNAAAEELKRAADARLTIGLNNFAQLEALKRLVGEGFDTTNVKCHIKIDSGMHRLGFKTEELEEALDRIKDVNVDVTGTYSHLRALSYAQKAEFEKGAGMIAARYPKAIRHLASSHSLSRSAFKYDMARVGLYAYRGAMEVFSEVISSRTVQKGEYISYGNYRAEKDINVATVFGGYADGIPRERPSAAYIRGRRCPVVGRVCMDMFMVDTGDIVAKSGEKVLLYSEAIADEVAKDRGTVQYTLMTGFCGRIRRVYVEGGGEEAREK